MGPRKHREEPEEPSSLQGVQRSREYGGSGAGQRSPARLCRVQRLGYSQTVLKEKMQISLMSTSQLLRYHSRSFSGVGKIETSPQFPNVSQKGVTNSQRKGVSSLCSATADRFIRSLLLTFCPLWAMS